MAANICDCDHPDHFFILPITAIVNLFPFSQSSEAEKEMAKINWKEEDPKRLSPICFCNFFFLLIPNKNKRAEKRSWREDKMNARDIENPKS